MITAPNYTLVSSGVHVRVDVEVIEYRQRELVQNNWLGEQHGELAVINARQNLAGWGGFDAV